MITEVGTTVISIPVLDLHQNPLDLMEKYKEKILLIIIYNNQCLGCTGRAIPLAYQFQKEYKDIQVLGIHTNFNKNVVTESDIRSIFTIEELPFPIYLDDNRNVYNQFQSSGTPQWVIISKEGILSRSIFGSQEGAQNRIQYTLEEFFSKSLPK